MTPFLSIIIPTKNEEAYIGKCLTSILSSTYPQKAYEIIVVDGMSEDQTHTIVNDYSQKNPNIRILDNPSIITPTALNIGLRASKGDFIVILSAHASYSSDYFDKLVSAAQRLGAECTGPGLITDSLTKTPTSLAIIQALGDRFGTGSRFRFGSDSIMRVDTVAFGCYRKDVFERFGLFDERLIRNQDIEFNKRIICGGGKIYLIPEATCIYYARETYEELAKNNYQNGYWNILTPFLTGTLRSLSLRHFIPLIFVSSLILPMIFGLLCSKLLWISPIMLGMYLCLIGIRSAQIKQQTSWFHQITAFTVLHFSYGIGGIGGIIALVKKILFRDNL